MKYNAIKTGNESVWCVMAGKDKHFSKSVGTKDHAENFANYMSALWYMEQSKIALKKINNDVYSMNIGHKANSIVDTVTDTLIDSGIVSESNPRSWLC